ncbi:Uncharacterized protein HZ326_28734 [Fusarium oxysporum f. sp. albedinis]|nr:Uncharacterized protein HZ326_28734 [Fusarium oxysporum f. sp. albedinis]
METHCVSQYAALRRFVPLSLSLTVWAVWRARKPFCCHETLRSVIFVIYLLTSKASSSWEPPIKGQGWLTGPRYLLHLPAC